MDDEVTKKLEADSDWKTKGPSKFLFFCIYISIIIIIFVGYRVLKYCLGKLGCGHGYVVLCRKFDNVE